jgi:hypothetical protein
MKIVVESAIQETPRVQQVRGLFDRACHVRRLLDEQGLQGRLDLELRGPDWFSW